MWQVFTEYVEHGHALGLSQQEWPCLGYRLEAEGKIIAISGDTIACEGLDKLAKDADLFDISRGKPEKDNIWIYMPYGPFENLMAMKQWLQRQAQSVDPLFFTVIDNTSHKCLGIVSFLNIVPDMRRLDTGESE